MTRALNILLDVDGVLEMHLAVSVSAPGHPDHGNFLKRRWVMLVVADLSASRHRLHAIDGQPERSRAAVLIGDQADRFGALALQATMNVAIGSVEAPAPRMMRTNPTNGLEAAGPAHLRQFDAGGA